MRIVILLFTAFMTAQVSAALMMSDKKAAAIGKEMHDKIMTEMPVYQDPKLNDYVTGVGRRVAQHSDAPEGTYTFTILDNPEINAFATPGGYVYINRGLLAYMNSEAQLAAVLAHEIAHVTARHAARQKRAQTGSNVTAGLLAVLTGSREVGEASAMWGAATVKGYGRDMELEADAIGAKVMARSGYPPQAMIEIITQLKDHERFTKKRSADSGQKVQTYHGLFSTHPRNDKRLLEMVKQSGGTTNGGDTNSSDPRVEPFRIATEGLPWGQNFEPTNIQPPNEQDRRYTDQKLGFTFAYPEGWQFTGKGNLINGQPQDQSATLSVAIKARTLDTPDLFIKKILGVGFIRKSEPIIVARLQGHTGIIPAGSANNSSDTRLAVIYYGHRAYVFKGTARSGNLDKQHGTDTYDNEFKNIIGSFQPRATVRRSNRPASIHYVKARAGATYDKLARQLHLGKYGADELRLINSDYPSGEPQAGQWIKIIR